MRGLLCLQLVLTMGESGFRRPNLLILRSQVNESREMLLLLVGTLMIVCVLVAAACMWMSSIVHSCMSLGHMCFDTLLFFTMGFNILLHFWGIKMSDATIVYVKYTIIYFLFSCHLMCLAFLLSDLHLLFVQEVQGLTTFWRLLSVILFSFSFWFLWVYFYALQGPEVIRGL